MQHLKNNIKYLNSINNTHIDENTKDIEVIFDICEKNNISIVDFLNKKIEFKKLCNNIKMLILDVDGVLSHSMYYTEKGDIIKSFNVKDGLGIKKLIEQGLIVGIISGSFIKESIIKRAKILGIDDVYIGPEQKMNILNEWCVDKDISIEDVAFIGDDENDREVLKNVGVSVCPSDANFRIKQICDIILRTKGGYGCVREFIDDYLI